MEQLLRRCAETALNSKLVARHKEFFAKMVCDAVMYLDDLLPLNMIGVKKVQGGALEVQFVVLSFLTFVLSIFQRKFNLRSMKISCLIIQESRLIQGVAFKKTFSYAGFEMQPKQYINPKIALLNVELELKAEKENAEIRVDNVEVLIS